MRFKPIYRLCPNCGGLTGFERLIAGLPCEACISDVRGVDYLSVYRELEENGKLAGLRWVYLLEREFREFSEYFRVKTGYGPWSAQASWARRLLELDSFTITAPTGVGKTTLLSVYTAYRAEVSGWKALYLVPTGNLARQVYERIKAYTDGVITYYSTMPPKAREEAFKAIERGDYRVLVLTTGFLQRRFNILRAPFNLVIVDDVDSILRDGRNVERILMLLGYETRTIELALNLVKTRIKFFNALQTQGDGAVKELGEKIAVLESMLREALRDTIGGQLIVASATGRPRGLKHLIFKELLNFEVGGGGDYLRNVIDAYITSSNPLEDVVSLVKRLGSRGIVFVSQYLGRDALEDALSILESSGLRVGKAIAGSWRSISMLEKGEIDVLISIASRYGVAVRGLDAPKIVKYAIFLGAPARLLGVGDALLNMRRLERVLIQMRDEGVEDAKELLSGLRTLIEKVGDPSVISIALKNGSSEERFGIARRAYEKALAWVEDRVRVVGRFKVGSMVFSGEGGRVYVLIPDVLTYIQASGRTSRLLEGKMTLGLSVVIEPMKELLESLEERLRWYGNFSFKNIHDLDLESVKELLEISRRGGGRDVRVRTALLVVESPTKAKTIAWFWGRPGRRRIGRITVYETSFMDGESGDVLLLQVTATRGHIFDLADGIEGSPYGIIRNGGSHSPVYDYIKRCTSCGHQFTSNNSCPRCGSADYIDSRSTVEALRKLAIEVDEVIVATDPDIEGEKIAWDVYLALNPYNSNIKRAAFHEVTKNAVIEALRNPGPINIKAVEAQITRRIVDRWIGYSISEHLQKIYGLRWLGAGRVQTPILSWVTSRYNEWILNKGYLVCAELRTGSRICVYTRDPGETESLSNSRDVKVLNVRVLNETISPPPPFTTDSLLYEASRRLKLGVDRTMRIAQELFESGLITYHRTDSTRVSAQGIGVARAYMEKRGLLELFKPRSWGDSGAHEAIRPTRPLDLEDLEKAAAEGAFKIPVKLTWHHRALYDLIFKRFTASQSGEARITRVILEVDWGGKRIALEGVGNIEERGFTTFYDMWKVDKWVMEISPGENIKVENVTIRKAGSTQLYTTGDIVKLMKEKGIGRPSTYSKVIEANRRHGYIIISKKRGYLIPTKLGIEIANYLKEHYMEITSEEYTRELEKKLDLIESDSIDPNTVLSTVLADLRRKLEVEA